MSDQTTTPDPRLRLAEIDAAKDLVLAAAITWWGDQIATDDMPEGIERALAAACDDYVGRLQIQFDRAGLKPTPARALLEQLASRGHGGLHLVKLRDDCGGA